MQVIMYIGMDEIMLKFLKKSMVGKNIPKNFKEHTVKFQT